LKGAMQGVGTTWPGLIGAVARATGVAGTAQSASAADDSVEQL